MKETTFFEAKKIDESYMKVKTYVTLIHRENPVSNSNQSDNDRALVKKLI